MTGRIFWASVAGFLLGVAACSLLPLGYAMAGALLLLGTCIAALSVLEPTQRSFALPVAALCAAAACGMVRMQVAALPADLVLAAHVGQKVMLEGRVVAEPDGRQDSTRVSLQAQKLLREAGATAARGGVLAVAPAHADVSYGDRVQVSGTLRAPAAFDSGQGRQFDYPSYLAAQGIQYELSGARIERIGKNAGNPLKAAAIALKETFERGLRVALPEPAAGFAGGITVGDKRSIGPDLSADFQRAGLIHMVVLSGYNITVVINAAAWLLERAPILQNMRAAPLGASGAIVALFVLMSGGASSAMRAGSMALIAVFAHLSRRTFLASRALGAAAVLIVAWNPWVLLSDPGFQLSALATTGLIAFTPLIAARLLWLPERWGLREIAASTIGTQLAVLPLLLYQNGALSLYALPANMLTLPLVPYAMFASLVAGIGGLLWQPIAVILGLPAYLLLSYILAVAQAIAHAPLSTLAIPAFGAWWLVPMYTTLFAGVWVLHKKRPSVKARPYGDAAVKGVMR